MRDYEELVEALREYAEWMGPNNYELPIAMHDDLMRAADALERLGPFGRLLVQYCGDPRGPAGRSGLPIEQEVLMQKPIEDIDGGKWIPVNAGALQELAEAYKKLLAKDTNVPAKWISVEERLPEESEGLNWYEDRIIRFTSVWCCDVNTGTIAVRNRLQGKKTGIEYLDQHTKDTDWHWSQAWWEPTHWMTIVPLPEPPKVEP